ncbi:MAG: hypothetical protein Q9170_006939 [Blastenia crenularia]
MAGHGIPRVSAPGTGTGLSSEQELRRIQNYKDLVDDVNTEMLEKNFTKDIFNMTSKLLEMNPEYYTVWNYRRLLLRSFFTQTTFSAKTDNPNDLSDIAIIQQYIIDDLAFLMPILRKFPKCYWIWNYRIWLLDEASRLLPSATAYDIWQKELALVGKMLSLDSRNFHGWGYRRKVVGELETLSVKTNSPTASMTEREFDYTTKMIESNLSNFSAWHRRSKLIPRLLNERNANQSEKKAFLDKELELIQRALWADPDSKDQSLWFYHQYLISNFEPSSNVDTIVPELSTDDKLEYVKAQIEDLREMLDGAETCKWIYQRLIDLASTGRRLDGQWPVESSLIETWLDKVTELDPPRKGRWDDLRLEFTR